MTETLNPKKNSSSVPLPKFWRWQPQLSRRSWKRQIYRELVFRGIYFTGRVILALGLERSVRLADRLGPILYRFKKRDRIVAEKNLNRAFKVSKPPEELERIGKKMFSNVAISTVEMIWMSRWNELEDWLDFEVEGRQHLDRALELGKGVICLNGHFGNWEAMSAWVCRQGYPGLIVARALKDPRLDSWVRQVRESCGIRVIDRGKNPIGLVRAIRGGGILGIMIDLDTGSGRGTFVDFLGKPAYTQVGAFELARKTGAALVPSLCYREGINRLRLVFDEPWWVEQTDNSERDVTEAASRATRYLEERITERPEQWAWFHKRWKTKPQRFKDPSGILKPEVNSDSSR